MLHPCVLHICHCNLSLPVLGDSNETVVSAGRSEFT